jgi:hypothetical protein
MSYHLQGNKGGSANPPSLSTALNSGNSEGSLFVPMAGLGGGLDDATGRVCLESGENRLCDAGGELL